MSLGSLAFVYAGVLFVGTLTTLVSSVRSKDSRRNLLCALVLTLMGWLGLTFSDMISWKASIAVAVIGTRLGTHVTRYNFNEILGLKQSRSALGVNRLMTTLGYIIGPLITIAAFTVTRELAAALFSGACLMVMLLVMTQWTFLLPNFDIMTLNADVDRAQRHPFQIHQMASQELLTMPLLSPEDAPDFSVRGARYKPNKLKVYAKLN